MTVTHHWKSRQNHGDNKSGGLPVLDGDKLWASSPETDIFQVFLEFGARDAGWRVSALVEDRKGLLAKLTSAISSRGGDFVTLGTFLQGEDRHKSLLVFKVREVTEADIRAALAEIDATDIQISRVP